MARKARRQLDRRNLLFGVYLQPRTALDLPNFPIKMHYRYELNIDRGKHPPWPITPSSSIYGILHILLSLIHSTTAVINDSSIERASRINRLQVKKNNNNNFCSSKNPSKKNHVEAACSQGSASSPALGWSRQVLNYNP